MTRLAAATRDFGESSDPRTRDDRGDPGPDAARPDILVVDDDAVLRLGLIDLFRLEGRTAVGATSGGEALFLLERGLSPGIILLDLDMPVMNGWDFVRALGRIPTLPLIPIVVISGVSSDRSIPQRETDAGFFRKPVNFDALLETVNRYLRPR